MLYYIKGKITESMPGVVAVDNNGVAFKVFVPDNSYFFICPKDEVVTVYTEMIVREDDISLYGFENKDSLTMFKLLMTVQGIGAKAALAVLSVLSASALRQAIIFEDVDSIQRANGIGKKTAQRIVMELKDKIEKSVDFVTADNTPAKNNSAKDEAVEALISLGFSKQEAMTALTGIQAEDAQSYITQALKNR